jgi:hypothetical protein
MTNPLCLLRAARGLGRDGHEFRLVAVVDLRELKALRSTHYSARLADRQLTAP